MNKIFWKNFFNTLKESKWLLLRYFLTGIFLIIIGIIANKLNLNDLTYYNSLITLIFFGEMISFGFSEGFGIYINQNINDKQKAQNYAKLGLYFTLFLSVILISMLAIFPNFIITNILNIDFEVDLAFYFIMLVAMFIDTIFNYYSHVLKKIGEFKLNFLATTIQSLLLIISLVALILFKNLSLIPISLIYLTSYIICFVFSHISLLKNKTLSVNLLKFEKLKLSKYEFLTVLNRTLGELVWEVGYFFISLFILKSDIIIYNQYCYYENVLDVLNGIFFAFVSVTSIKIARCIGESKKDEAYQIGKDTMLSTFIIWIFYAILSMMIYYPLMKAMNIELQSTALLSYILFLIVALFRFFEWALGTYILGQSEYYSKLGLILELIFTTYWIILYLTANLLPLNVFIIYVLIAIDSCTKFVISLKVFKDKKWLERS